MKQEQLFSGLKVVELAGVLAGPAVGMFFAELGADVIKVENKRTGGDVTRTWKLPVEDPGAPASSYYHSVNWGKQIVFADLSDRNDRSRVIEMISTADVLLVNFKPGDEQKLDMVSDDLLKMFPRLIIGRISGFGLDDPRPAFDAVLQAASGFMSLNGEPGGTSLKMPVALIDVISAHQLKEALLIALLHRERTGFGSLVDVSLYDAAIVSLMNQSSAWLNTGVVPQKQGSLHPNIAPYGETFECADGKEVLLAVGTDQQFEKLLLVINQPQLMGDVRFATNTNRLLNRNELIAILRAAFKTKSSEEWLHYLHEQKIPGAAVQTIDQVFATGKNRHLILDQVEQDGGVSKRCKTIAFKIHGTDIA